MATRDDVLDVIERIESGGGGTEGWAAQAMKQAEAALAQQLSTAANFDRQTLEALRHARKITLEGRRRLEGFEAEIAGAAGSWDLSTAAGAREFQRFLIDKLEQIIKLVEEANDDDGSKHSLATALRLLYSAVASDSPEPAPEDEHTHSGEPDTDPYLDELTDEDPEAVAEIPHGLPLWAPPMFPSMGGEGPGFGPMPAGFPSAGLTPGLGSAEMPAEDDYLPEEAANEGAGADGADAESEQEPGEEREVIVRLPDGETISMANPRLAAVTQAVADGKSVVEAFRSQGIHIPPPGAPVAAAVDVASLRPGDIGVFTDRHALAVGAGKALLDGQIHLVDNLQGPGFLGWQHPPGLSQEPAPPLKKAAPTVIVK
ncbi:hypothetical protein A5735_20010 [Mycolicibacter heraklionensis]|nr:hypothetical protein A5735_20010 [Mycolicibacter heraklionensis]